MSRIEKRFFLGHFDRSQTRVKALYTTPELYDEAALGRFSKRDNLARGVVDVVDANTQIDLGKNVLELGAGTGILTLELAQRGYFVTALDLQTEALARATEKAKQSNIDHFVTTVPADMNHPFPFEDNAFDAMVSLRATRYITNFDQWLGEVHRVLKPGGLFLLPNFKVDLWVWRQNSEKGLRQRTGVRSMTRAVANADFEIDRVASGRYRSVVDLSKGNRDVPFYYAPSFVVARKT